MLMYMAIKSKVLSACLTLPTEIAVIFNNTFDASCATELWATFQAAGLPISPPCTFRLVAFNLVLAKWIAVLSDGLQSQLQIMWS